MSPIRSTPSFRLEEHDCATSRNQISIMDVDRSKRNRSSETTSPQPPTLSTAERHALLEQDALEKENLARQARVKAEMAGAVLRAEQALEKEMKKINAKSDGLAPKAAPFPAPDVPKSAETPAQKSPAANPASPTSPSTAASMSSRRTRVLPALSKLKKEQLLALCVQYDTNTTKIENSALSQLTVPALRDYLYELDKALHAKKLEDGGTSSTSPSQARRTKSRELG